MSSFGRESQIKSFCTSRLTRGARQFALLPSLRPRVKRRSGKDFDELRRFVKHWPPTLELLIRLGEVDKAHSVVEMIRSANESVSVRATAQLASVVFDQVQIEIVRETSGTDAIRRYLAEQFRRADQDNNKYLDETEIQTNRVFKAAFNQFDTDSDGKMFEKEMTAAIAAREKVARVRTRMSIRNRGRDLFQILDGDRNGRLSRREFAAAALRIELWDDDGDGTISSHEVPQLFQLWFGPGQPVFRGLQLPVQTTSALARHGVMGPVWFQKMDRNDDGELARREFPGTRAEYRRLDVDGNGFVDALEAAEAAARSKE